MPELVLPALADADDEALTNGIYPDFDQLQRRIAAGEPCFAASRAPTPLLADLRLARRAHQWPRSTRWPARTACSPPRWRTARI
ncbi:MAG: hypothetical protein IPO35_07885 [Uliginosibacterium sp.]|nr:hypothetical protein [Uliginosibacterium sp.]